jgi:hypothetical protein
LIRHSIACPRRTISRWEAQLLSAAMRLLLHNVDSGDRLGDRMLDLDAGVHLDEFVVLIKEFDVPARDS